ncbi:MAG: hypothetical protein LBD03_08185 [Methanobrevibacter sp.]|jgi:hypothetical protein|nr:hypothetical protein [Candidatus Methanovirga procula]
MKIKESLTIILILIAILTVFFVGAATPAYVHIMSVTDTPDGLLIQANITLDQDGTTLLPSGYGIQAKYNTNSSIGQPSSAGSNYTTTGYVNFTIANRHTYDYNSITVSFDDYYPGNYTAVPDTWINNMPSGPNIDVTTTPDTGMIIIKWDVGTPIFVNNSTGSGDTNISYNVQIENNDTGNDINVGGDITFNSNQTTDDPSKINSDGSKNGTVAIPLPDGNYTGQFVVPGNADDGRKGSSSNKFSFTVGGSSEKSAGIPLEKTGLPTYGLMGILLTILLFFQSRIKNK